MLCWTYDTIPFAGELVKIELESDRGGFGPGPIPPLPLSFEEWTQKLTISLKSGKAKLKHCFFKDGNEYTEKKELTEKQKKRIATVFETIFCNEPVSECVCDAPAWTLILTNADGKRFMYCGSFGWDMHYHGQGVSDLLREILGFSDLWGFAKRTDKINRIELKLRLPKRDGDNAQPGEQITIDREAGQIQLRRKLADGRRIRVQYDLGEGVSEFLDELDADTFLAWPGPNDWEIRHDGKPALDKLRTYKIAVTYAHKLPMKIIGTFDLKGLPDDYRDFAEELRRLLGSYIECRALDEDVYGGWQSPDGKILHVKVEFAPGGKTYEYAADDPDLRVGDTVLVPVGAQETEKSAIVTEILYYKPEDEPTFGGKLKRVLRRG